MIWARHFIVNTKEAKPVTLSRNRWMNHTSGRRRVYQAGSNQRQILLFGVSYTLGGAFNTGHTAAKLSGVSESPSHTLGFALKWYCHHHHS